jgi:outer membrane immunogenic protein
MGRARRISNGLNLPIQKDLPTMKNLLLASVAAAVLGLASGTPAFTADLSRKAPAPIYTKAPPLPFSWSGFYAGVSAGYGWSTDDVDTTTPALAPPPPINAALSSVPNLHFDTDPKGFLGGGTLGYNYQTGRFVLGVETDLSWANIKGTNTQGVTVGFGGAGNTVTSSGTAEQKMDAFGTLRARLGFTPIDKLLVFGTGGLAYGHLESNTNIGGTVTNPPPILSNAIGSASAWRAGWTAGAGVEYAFAPRWSAKAEYLYYDLGDLHYDSTLLCSAGGQCRNPPITIGISSTADFKGNIVRAGINYRFN